MKDRYAVIVDGYSAGNLLAPEFKSRGIQCLHVQSTPEIWPILKPSFRVEDYAQNFKFTGDIEAVLSALGGFSIVAVLPGTETGVELSDILASRLQVPSNSLEKSSARRNKYLMVESVRDKGLRAAKQTKASSSDEAISWWKESGLSKIVVKPLNSAGTDSVVISSVETEIRAACETILGKTNMLGLQNSHVLIQEYLEGSEFFVNTVSRDGHHHFTEIWKYKKRTINGHDCVYDCNELLPFDGEVSGKLRCYVWGVLDALEIQQGPAHTEVILTPQGPVLVESGARLDGLSVPLVNKACIGYSPIDLSVDRYCDDAAWALKTKEPYALKKHALTVYLTSYQDGLVESIEGTAPLKNLPSFFQMRLRVSPGSKVKRTIDYFTAPGFLTLVHEDPGQLQADYELIRKWERDGQVFKVQEA